MKIQGEVLLKKGRDASARRYHPWIFSGAVQSSTDSLSDGDWVQVKSASGESIGFGHYQKGTITVRILSFEQSPPASDFYERKLVKAFQQRMVTHVVQPQTNAFRLVHGEGDGLSGLIIDLYYGVAVMQAHSPGFFRDRKIVGEALKKGLPDFVQAVYFKDQNNAAESAQSAYLLGMGVVPHVIMEHGRKFLVDWETGQKTGFFLDQRENRRLLGEYANGAQVLNTF